MSIIWFILWLQICKLSTTKIDIVVEVTHERARTHTLIQWKAMKKTQYFYFLWKLWKMRQKTANYKWCTFTVADKITHFWGIKHHQHNVWWLWNSNDLKSSNRYTSIMHSFKTATGLWFIFEFARYSSHTVQWKLIDNMDFKFHNMQLNK